MPSLMSNAIENKTGEHAAGKLLLTNLCCKNTVHKMLLTKCWSHNTWDKCCWKIAG